MPASSVSFKRIDSLSPNAPNRYITSIYVDPTNANHAWISYSGFSSATPTTPAHVFEVTYNMTAGTATWVSLDKGMGALPITALVRDDQNDALYAGTDTGSTILPGARLLYAATHGLGAWVLNLDQQ